MRTTTISRRGRAGGPRPARAAPGLGPLLALALAACATAAPPAPLPSAPAPEAAAPPADAPLPPLDPARVDAVLAAHPAPGVGDALRRLLVVDGPWRPRLLGPRADHPALDALVAAGRAAEDDGIATADRLGLAPLASERARLAEARAALDRAPPPPDARGELLRATTRVEVLAWRLAAVLAWELAGGQVEERALLGLPGQVIADPDGWTAAYAPADPSWPVLLEARRRFAHLAHDAAGRETRVGLWFRLRPGHTDPDVARLRARLAEVGLPAPPVGAPETFDEPLRLALLDFQRRHLLPDTGRPDGDTLKELAVPVRERLAALEAALAWMRTRAPRRYPTRLDVNIAAYELQLWLDGRPVRRHRVVVGRPGWAHDEAGDREGYLNRTPTLESTVTDLILNPRWRVPQRIKEQELDRIADRNPAYYDDFDIYVDREGNERVVQLPGPGNALGRVKFVFSGGDGVYLHDTPLKRAFERSRRNLSHGCVRVQDALDLARTLLEHDGHRVTWDRARAILHTRREVQVTLNRPVPVLLDYVTAGASADGELRFYPDVYGWGPVVDGAAPSR